MYRLCHPRRPWLSKVRAALCVAALFAAANANAGPITFGVWNQFSFADQGVAAVGCAPADAGGNFCTPSSGTATTFVDAPPWTFLAPATGVTLRLVDAFTTLQQFEIRDAGQLVGLTSAPNPLGDCGDDPVACLADPNASQGSFFLAAGARSITITPTVNPDGLGSAFFIVDAVDNNAIPEPGTLMLVAGASIGLGLLRRFGRQETER